MAEALAHLEKTVVDGLRHGFFECSITCEIGNGPNEQGTVGPTQMHLVAAGATWH